VTEALGGPPSSPVEIIRAASRMEGLLSKRYHRTDGAGHIKPSGRLNLRNLCGPDE
jgi:hypothetical protein